MNNATVETRIETLSQWEVASARFTVAEAINRQYFAEVYSPAVDAEKAFEKVHGLALGQSGYVERRKALEEKHQYRMARSIEETADRLCNEACAAEDAMMQMPAPNHAALLVKLEKLLAISNGATDSWSADYVRQTIGDMRRLLA